MDEDLPGNAPKRVRVIVLFDGEMFDGEMFDGESDLNEKNWWQAVSKNDLFDLLNDEAEDIYMVTDGKP